MVRFSLCLLAVVLGPGSLALAQEGPAAAPEKAPRKGRGPGDVGELKRSHTELVAMLGSQDETTRNIARRAILRRGDEALPALRLTLRGKSAGAVSIALGLVIERGGCPEVEPELLGLLDRALPDEPSNQDFALLKEAARSLALARSAKAIPRLVELLEGERWFVVAEAARAALVLYGEAALEPLVASYREAKSRASGAGPGAYRVLLALGEIGGDEARVVLCEAMVESAAGSTVLRRCAAVGLGMLGDRQGVATLIGQLERERDHYVQKYIVRALSSLTGQSFPVNSRMWRSWWERSKLEFLKEVEVEVELEEDPAIPVPRVSDLWKKRKAERAKQKSGKP
jgi:HEAT repeat protein